MLFFRKKKNSRSPNVECSRKLLRILGYIYTGIYIYIYTHLQKKQHLSPMNLHCFTEISKKMFFPKNRDFGNVFPYNEDVLLKTKMVRTVHRNILYSVDLKIRDSIRGSGTKSQKWHFQKWCLKNWKLRFWGSKWGLWSRSRRQKYSKIYSGLIPHHPNSIFIYKKLIL